MRARVEDFVGLSDVVKVSDEDLAFLDLAADFNKSLGARAGRTIERAHHG